jgi:hypothetical protein
MTTKIMKLTCTLFGMQGDLWRTCKFETFLNCRQGGEKNNNRVPIIVILLFSLVPVFADCFEITSPRIWLKHKMLSRVLCLYFMNSNLPSFSVRLYSHKINCILPARDNREGLCIYPNLTFSVLPDESQPVFLLRLLALKQRVYYFRRNFISNYQWIFQDEKWLEFLKIMIDSQF